MRTYEDVSADLADMIDELDDGCPLYLGKPYCALPDRMRELGIRVNDCE